MSKITAANLWLIHSIALGGKSAVTGADLPATINDCLEGVQASHYAMACAVATAYGDPDVVPVPPKVSEERARSLREQAQRQGRSIAGLGDLFAKIHPTS